MILLVVWIVMMVTLRVEQIAFNVQHHAKLVKLVKLNAIRVLMDMFIRVQIVIFVRVSVKHVKLIKILVQVVMMDSI